MATLLVEVVANSGRKKPIRIPRPKAVSVRPASKDEAVARAQHRIVALARLQGG